MARSDTNAEARAVQQEAYRSLTGPERVRLAFSVSEEARRISLEGIASRLPHLSEEEVLAALIEILHGPAVAAAIRRQAG